MCHIGSISVWIKHAVPKYGMDRKLNSPSRLGESVRVELDVGLRKSRKLEHG